MIKIPVKEAINSGAWFHCVSESYEFRLKIISFEKVNLGEVDWKSKIRLGFEKGIFWLLKLELINLTKRIAYSQNITSKILIFDHEEFEFQQTIDPWLSDSSKIYACETGLATFYQGNFIPKTKYTGAITFMLPDEEGAEYYVSVVGGNIQEV